MSRILRAGLAAGLIAVSFGASSASACVTFERHYVGGENWTAVVMVPVVHCL